MAYSKNEVLKFVSENDVKFIRLAFCDVFGEIKNISIMPRELPLAFEKGVTFEASRIPGLADDGVSELVLRPDPTTITILPWRPQNGRVARLFCDIMYPDGRHFESDARWLLAEAGRKFLSMGYTVYAGTECEFYLFKLDNSGNPTREPLDKAGYFDVAPKDRGENIRRQICLSLDEMGITPEYSHHEKGPGQNEIIFSYAQLLAAADNFVTYKMAVKSIAGMNGLFASFMPKPLPDWDGSGLHINFSVYKDGTNLFKNFSEDSTAGSMIAGILNRIREISLFINPIANSYSRLGNYEAPHKIDWSLNENSKLIRILCSDSDSARFELRSGDPCFSPYLSMMLIIYAALEGVEKGEKLTDVSGETRLPVDLGESIECAKNSEFIKAHLPESLLNKYIAGEENLWKACQSDVDGNVDNNLFERL